MGALSFGTRKRGREDILAKMAWVRWNPWVPRQVRIEFPGAIYHVMCRGDRKEPIFGDDTDCEIFLKTLGEAGKRSGWLLC